MCASHSLVGRRPRRNRGKSLAFRSLAGMIISVGASAKPASEFRSRFDANTSDDDLKGNPAMPGGPLTSKPMWSSASVCPATSAFFCATNIKNGNGQRGWTPLNQPRSNKAEQIAEVAKSFEQERTGHRPKSVTVVLSDDALVITLHGALSEAEKALARDPDGAAKVQEFHQQLFASAAGTLRREIKRITGVKVREATAEIEPSTGTLIRAFASGTVVQVFLLARSVDTDVWSNHRPTGTGQAGK
jgi:uncharacterized protein YbcI